MRSRSRRGTGTLIAAAFLVIIVLLAFAAFDIERRRSREHAEELREELRRRAAEGALEVVSVEFSDGALNVTAANRGAEPILIEFVGVFSAETKAGRYYNATEAGSGAPGVLVGAGETKTNITTLEPLAQDLSSGSWVVQLLTSSGAAVSARYPPEVAGIQAWDILYAPRNFPPGSSACLAATTAEYSTTPSSAANTTGNYVSGTLESLQAVDADYYVIESTPTGSATTAYHPSSYAAAAGALLSGTVADLAADDQVYMVFRAEPSALTNTLYAHQETVTVAATAYYMLKSSPADAEGIALAADCSTEGAKYLGSFVFPLRAVDSLPAATYTFYYRGFRTGRRWFPLVYFYTDVYVLHADGTLTYVGTSSGSDYIGLSNATLSDSLDLADSVAVADTDYLRLDFYAYVVVARTGTYAYLIVDDSSLPPADQTRLEVADSATGAALPTFPTQYKVEVELTGTSNTAEQWLQLAWAFDSAYTLPSVSVTLQLYDYANNAYPASGDGYMSYVSSSTPDTDELQSQLITVNPSRFRDPATGEWKLKATAVRDTDFNERFDAKFDLAEYEPTYYNRYEAELEVGFSGLSDRQTVRLDVEVVVNHSVALTVYLYMYNYATGAWDQVASASYATPDADQTVAASVTASAQSYVSGGAARLRVRSVEVSEDAVSFEQRTNYALLTQTYIESSAVYVGRGGTGEFYCFLPSTGQWLAKASPPNFVWHENSSMVFLPATGRIYAINVTGSSLSAYDVALDSWSEVSALPAPPGVSANLASCPSHPDLVFYFVGDGSGLLYAYNTTSGLWSQLTGPPEPLGDYALAAGSDSDLIFLVVGGTSDGFYAYNATSGLWSQLSPSPSSKPVGLAYWQGYAYMLDSGGGLHRYSLAGGAWEALAPRPGVAFGDEGNRLLCDGQRLYLVRMDGSREVLLIALASLGAA